MGCVLRGPSLHAADVHDPGSGCDAGPDAHQGVRGADSGAQLKLVLCFFRRVWTEISNDFVPRWDEFEVGRELQVAQQRLESERADHDDVVTCQIRASQGPRISHLDWYAVRSEEVRY